jgi:hypothetical protein
VLEIARTHLDDRDAMADHFRQLARAWLGQAAARRVREDRSWFTNPDG